jgi:hypothetical protein
MELKHLGYSPIEIADVLVEKSLHGPWIFGTFEIPTMTPFEENFHLNHCIHNEKSIAEVKILGKR